MRNFVRVMRALSDPGRVKIVKLLGRGELCVCELTALLGLAQPTVSKHLRVLEEAGLVRYRKEGSWIIYRLPQEADSVVAGEMLARLALWLEDDPQLRALLERLPEMERCRIRAA
ncbi:MAG: transcriptional regulator [Desulfobulbaceae bacterium A2]|nr:MAG: transcriptional regulator [Desulfobulbaceae bacterium A2]